MKHQDNHENYMEHYEKHHEHYETSANILRTSGKHKKINVNQAKSLK